VIAASQPVSKMLFVNKKLSCCLLYYTNTLVQLLAQYTDPESLNAQRYRQTDGRTDGRQNAADSRSNMYNTVRSANNVKSVFL